MPIQMAEMTRRGFLAATAGGAVALHVPWASGQEAAAEDQFDLVVLLSDPHIDADAAKVVRGVNMSERFSQVVERVRRGPRPVFVAINGDLARDDGQLGDYRRFEQLLAPLRDQSWVVVGTLGNHDHRGRYVQLIEQQLGHALADDDWRVPGKLASGLPLQGQADGTVWVFLDSLRETDEIAGELGQAQIDWLAKVLDQSPGAPHFVVVHHQPEDPKDPDDDGFGLADSKALLDLLWDRKQVKAVFHGHRHAWGVRQVNGMHIVGLPATSYVFEEGEPTGYVEARPRKDHIELTRRCLDLGHPAEGEVHRLAYR